MHIDISPERLTRADWEVILKALTADMDPWDIDLVELVRRFRKYLADLHALELEVPGRMVLVGSVLLRLKSEILRETNGHDGNGSRHEETGEALLAAAEEAEYFPEDGVYIAPEFRLPLVRRPRRKVTLAELEEALRAALAQEKRKRKAKPQRRAEEVPLPQGEPFTVRARRLLKKLLSLVNGKRDIPFRMLLSGDDPAEAVARFMELLHLDAEGKVVLTQKRFLGELIVKVPDHGKKRKDRR
jgi:chromatin segregation and condensation protein Rec8/ScpA/Scc1 (kleisin family)